MQPVADEGAARGESELVACIVGLRHVVRTLERVEGHKTLVLETEERAPLPCIPTGLGGGHDDAVGRLLILGLVVLRDDAKLLNRASPERIAAAAILADHAAAENVALVACPIDEHVDLIGAVRRIEARTVRAGDELPFGAVDLVVLRGDAWSQRGQVEDVAVGSRQVVDLLLGHVGRDL